MKIYRFPRNGKKKRKKKEKEKKKKKWKKEKKKERSIAQREMTWNKAKHIKENPHIYV